MKAILTTLTLFFSILVYAQSDDYNIYILLKVDDNLKTTRNDSLTSNLHVYFLPFKDCAPTEKLEITNNGKLKTTVSMQGGPNPLLRLTYLNEAGDNIPHVITTIQKHNVIEYSKHFYMGNYETVMGILEKAENIYLIEASDNQNQSFFMAKKVDYEKLAGL